MLKKLIIFGIVILFSLLLVNFASAEFWACFNYGEVINYCPYKADKTCDTNPICKLCMSRYYEDKYPEDPNCYVHHGDWSKCNDLPPDECFTNGNIEPDGEPPELTLINPSPLNDSLFTSKSIVLTYHLNEKAHVYYYSRDRWVRICNLCNGDIEQRKSFDEGDNVLHLKAVDVVGNKAYVDVEFSIDSKKPKISKTEPRRGYADGNFYVEFTEENPDSLVLTYGNSFVDEDVDLGTCYDLDRGKKGCDVFVDLTDFDGSDIEYWFNLTDVAGNFYASKPNTVSVDLSPPEINGLTYPKDGKYVYFTIDIDELNFDEVSYIDNLDPKAKWRRLCSRLNDGICEKKVSFKDGEHEVVINVTDEAGNYASQELLPFYTDSKDPRISRTNPRRGFADGNFDVEFKEENPVSLFLHYNNSLTGYDSQELNIGTDCVEDRGRYQCSTFADLTAYDTQEIEYWFTVEDVVGNTDESRRTELDVDTTFPEMNILLPLDIDGRYVTFIIEVTELNFDEVSYIDNSNPDRERRLCSRLDDGICEKRVSFRQGDYDLTIKVTDEAGNSIGEGISFTIV